MRYQQLALGPFFRSLATTLPVSLVIQHYLVRVLLSVDELPLLLLLLVERRLLELLLDLFLSSSSSSSFLGGACFCD